jgi:serine/threonine protein kinase
VQGTLENGKEVAVKRLRDSERTIQELEREISIVANLLRHKNLVRFLGYCFQEEGRFLIYEYVPNNSLEKFWYKGKFIFPLLLIIFNRALEITKKKTPKTIGLQLQHLFRVIG